MRLWIVALPLLLAASSARADDALKVEVEPKALEGQGEPALLIRAERPLKKLNLEVKRSTDGKLLKLNSGALSAGRTHRFPLSMNKPGKAQFTGTLSVELDNGEGGEMPVSVEVELVAPLKLKIAQEDVALESKKLKLSSDRPVKRIQISLMSDLGTPLGTTVKDFGKDPEAAGAPIEVGWKQEGKGNVMRITVQAWDPDEFFGAIDLFPWKVDIPHEEVNFASGSFEIPTDQTKKLKAALDSLKTQIEKYGKLATIKLFIRGHTDTVGDAGSNLTLSNNRARAIGSWFKKQGVAIPIQCSGAGETVPMVQTPDETDEPKNRRVEYTVAVEPPVSARWQPL
jgi:outer membrane protein OmpA-like peptidoglycan-associated protein